MSKIILVSIFNDYSLIIIIRDDLRDLREDLRDFYDLREDANQENTRAQHFRDLTFLNLKKMIMREWERYKPTIVFTKNSYYI